MASSVHLGRNAPARVSPEKPRVPGRSLWPARFIYLSCALALAACDSSTVRRGGAGGGSRGGSGGRVTNDATVPDVSSLDALVADGPAIDVGPAVDAGFLDLGFADATTPDAGFRDAQAVPDAGPMNCVSPTAQPGLVINEIDYDQSGIDEQEFIEIFNASAVDLCLTNVELILINGDNNRPYLDVDLSRAGAMLAPGGYLLLAGPMVVPAPGALILRFGGPSNQVQNGGPDGVLLRDRITGQAIDALSYEGELRTADVDGRIYTLVEGRAIGVQDNASTASLGRVPNGVDTNNAFFDWARLATPTPGASNTLPNHDAGVSSDAGAAVRSGVYLYTGASGGGPSSDLFTAEIENLYRNANIPVTRSIVVPSDVSSLKLLAILNPTQTVPAGLVSAAQSIVRGGGRLLLVMEHCKDGCFGNEAEMNRLLQSLPSSLRMSGMGGAPLSRTSLDLIAVPPLTDGVSNLVVYYSGSVTSGTGTALGTISGGDGVIAYESVGPGEVVAIADSSMFGFVLADGDNRRFIENLAR